jgi:hypothetical protein
MWNVLGTRYPFLRKAMAEDDEGEHDEPSGTVHLSDKYAAHLTWEIESHELGHVVERIVGYRRYLIDDLGLADDVAMRIVERWFTTWLPVYLDTLERNGFLKPPRGES